MIHLRVTHGGSWWSGRFSDTPEHHRAFEAAGLPLTGPNAEGDWAASAEEARLATLPDGRQALVIARQFGARESLIVGPDPDHVTGVAQPWRTVFTQLETQGLATVKAPAPRLGF